MYMGVYSILIQLHGDINVSTLDYVWDRTRVFID